jgi:hypothetical protein
MVAAMDETLTMAPATLGHPPDRLAAGDHGARDIHRQQPLERGDGEVLDPGIVADAGDVHEPVDGP